MIVTELRRLLLLLLLLALQVFVCNHIRIMGYATPLVYVYFLLQFPLAYPRSAALLWSFAMGLSVDIFSNTPGLAAAATTLAAMLQPVVLRHITTQEGMDDERPGTRPADFSHNVRYMVVLVSIHHTALFLLESFSFFRLADVALGCVGSIALTSLLLWTAVSVTSAKR